LNLFILKKGILCHKSKASDGGALNNNELSLYPMDFELIGDWTLETRVSYCFVIFVSLLENVWECFCLFVCD
jgi:hypothetical protein